MFFFFIQCVCFSWSERQKLSLLIYIPVYIVCRTCLCSTCSCITCISQVNGLWCSACLVMIRSESFDWEKWAYITCCNFFYNFFRSPVVFVRRRTSFVGRRLFNIFSFFLEPLNKFQPNLAYSIFGKSGVKMVISIELST